MIISHLLLSSSIMSSALSVHNNSIYDTVSNRKHDTMNHDDVMKEYDLILKKKSKLSAKKRKAIIDYVERTKG